MPEGLEGVKLTIYNEDGTKNTTQHAMVNAVVEEESTVKKLAFDIITTETGEVIATKRVAFNALMQAVEAFE